MTSFASAAVAVLLAASAAGETPDAPPVPGEFAHQVAARIAESWSVPVDAVRLSWPRPATPPAIADGAAFRLAGRGIDGWFIVVTDPAATNAAAIRVRAGTLDTVRVATRALLSGARIADGDWRDDCRIAWGAPATQRAERASAGWEIRRAVAAGEALRWPIAVAPPLISAGEPVRLVWTRGGVDIALSGVAIQSARKGERVRVRVNGRPDPLIAIATDHALATLEDGGRR